MAAECETVRGWGDSHDHEPQSQHRLSRIGAGLTSIACLQPQFLAGKDITCLNLHANSITQIMCLETLTALRELNLSSNFLASLQGLPPLPSLQILNLASNQLRSLEGMCRIPSLTKLSVAHNYLNKLTGIEVLQGDGCCLMLLDIHNNPIQNLAELAVLASFPKLRELTLSNGGQQVGKENDYRRVLSVALPQIELIDGQPAKFLKEDQNLNSLPCQLAATQLQAFDSLMNQEAKKLRVSVTKHEKEVPCPRYTTSEKGNPARFPKTDMMLEEFHNRRQPTQPPSNAIKSHLELKSSSSNHIGGASKSQNNIGATATTNISQFEAIDSPKLDRALRLDNEVSHALVQTNENFKHIQKLEKDRQELQMELQALKDMLDEEQLANNTLKQNTQETLKSMAESCKHEIECIQNTADQEINKAREEAEAASTAAKEVGEKENALRDALIHSQESSKEYQETVTRLGVEIAGLHSSAMKSEAVWRKKLDDAQSDAEVGRNTLQQALDKSRDQLTITKAALEAQGQDYYAMEQQLHSMNAAMIAIQAQGMNALTGMTNQVDGLQEERNTALQQVKQLQDVEKNLRQEVLKLTVSLETCRQEHEKDLSRLEEKHKAHLDDEVKKASLAGETKGFSLATMEAKEEKEKLLRITESLESELKEKLKESNQECSALASKLDVSKNEALELRCALEATIRRHEQQDGVVKELANIVEQQKSRLKGLLHERQILLSKESHYSKEKVDELEREVSKYRNCANEVSMLKGQISEIQKRCMDAEALNEALKKEKSLLEQELASKKSICDKKLADMQKEVDEERALHNRVNQELQDVEHAVKVKSIMIDSANATIAELKAEVKDLNQEIEDSKEAVDAATNRALQTEEDVAGQVEGLRREIETQDKALEEAGSALGQSQKSLHEWEKKAKKAEAELLESNKLMAYAEEEINRCKEMYEERLAVLLEEKESAEHRVNGAIAAEEKLASKLGRASDQLNELEVQIKEEQIQRESAEDLAKRLASENKILASRLQEVEGEMRSLLTIMEKQKQASAAKVDQLAKLVNDLKSP